MTNRTDAGSAVSLFGLASARMDWLAARQKVIAANIANADTPGYSARDVTGFEDYLTEGRLDSRAAASAWDRSPDGNRVVLEEQTLLATDTEENHRLAARLYRKGHDLIAIAAGK